MNMFARNDRDRENTTYVRLNKAHWHLSALGVGMVGALVILLAFYPKTESGAMGFMIFLFAMLSLLPLNSYITYWQADGEGFRFRNILKNVFIPANDVRQIRIVIHSLGEFLSIQGSKKEIGVPLREDGVAELMEFIMRNYPENVWFAGKDFMIRFVEVRKRKSGPNGTRTW